MTNQRQTTNKSDHRVLIFPAGMPRSLSFLDQALNEGKEVIGSSSLRYDPEKSKYPKWCYLPFVTDENFDQSLKDILSELSIDSIYTPNAAVWNYLKFALPRINSSVSLINESPIQQEMLPYKKAIDFAKNVLSTPIEIGNEEHPAPLLDELTIAAIFRYTELIPGMCDHEKFRALCEIFRLAPSGDIVEIGSWCGKSAFILANLANLYQVGNVLCVDPWSNNHVMQHDDKGNFVNNVDYMARDSLDIFKINLILFFKNSLNYIQLPSKDGAKFFRKNNIIYTKDFSKTIFQGKISILHIDGNHDYDNVKEDVISWIDMVVPGGWVVFDDYIWPYGDGPKKVGDEFILKYKEKINLSFVMGSALFIQLLNNISN